MKYLTVWRLEQEAYTDDAFTGEGSALYGNRFNSQGTKVVYTSENLPLALLETLVGMSSYEDLRRYVFFKAEIPQNAVVSYEAQNLPEGWDSHPPSAISQDIGDAWAASRDSLALRVPSVIAPYSYNYLLNPEHSAFSKIRIHDAEQLPVDDRLVR